MNQERIGKFIAECRKEKGLTQSELAEQLGVSEKSIGNWENGRNMPDLSLFKPLCEILGISINDFMSGEKVDDKDYRNALEENVVNLVSNIKPKRKWKRNLVIISMMVIMIFTGILIYNFYEEDIEYDSRVMKCNIEENELTFYISGVSVLNTEHTVKTIDDKQVYFFHSTINLYNKKYRDWEIAESMKSLLGTGEATYGSGEYHTLNSNNVEVYYTDKPIKKVEKASTKELEKIMEESYFMCSSND